LKESVKEQPKAGENVNDNCQRQVALCVVPKNNNNNNNNKQLGNLTMRTKTTTTKIFA